MNPKSVLISGESGTGKSLSLKNLKNPEGVLYLNCEGGKPLPFKNKFKQIIITDPLDIVGYYDQIHDDKHKRFHTIVIDTISFMMDMFESRHVKGSSNTMQMWGEYGDFFRNLMLDSVADSPAMSIFLGHLQADLVEETGTYRYVVPVKGALAKKGLEAYFTTVINVRKVPVKTLQKTEYKNGYLDITKRDEMLGYKHVYQTLTTKDTVGDRIRSPLGLFSDEETYIDNDAQIVMDRLNSYY